ncbi:MAG: aminotransferase class IV [Alphaproteobacteria bacterium]|jgi:branched-chain amino acid aminotransferase|nr:branched-chain amino acid--2-keto-4-methylthiobutyrate aminotransferase [Rhodospirillaceae bacterium]MBT7614673.1 branched-chain amino acid--2-keto-4-methylthiobutyrate aminotransferase [Rhodospirillaceae bacterium]MBT7647110.1 branched-chain amino acid--2-keto-4-methylthiobutyrate aminotransferase [Rhodospirillaceae bacterium]MDG2480060.1 aminotransferase class IV [Alphaproteobacteria bacterium]
MAAVEKPFADHDIDWTKGAAWCDGDFVPAKEAKLSVFDWGFTRSDVTYDVVHVWKGSFFRLDDHLDRFLNSVEGLRMELPVDRDGLAGILNGCVARSGLQDSYVAMVCTRGIPDPSWPKRLPSNFKGQNNLICYAIPFVWIMKPEIQETGGRMIIAEAPRIAPASVDPTIKNYHWGDFTNALFEVEDNDADHAVLMGPDGFVSECPGSNIFAVLDGVVTSPGHGALEGITRKAVHELCDLMDLPNENRDITRDELLDADEIFMASTAGGVMPIRQINERMLSNGAPGPISRRIHSQYWAKHDEGWKATPVSYG